LGPHSWDGGVSPINVLWAVQIPNGSAHVDLETGAGSLHVENLSVLDAFTVANSVQGVSRAVNQVLGVLNSLDIQWSGIIAKETAIQPVNQMRGSFTENTAKIAVTATTPRTMVTSLSNGHGFRFVSNAASTSLSNFALIGQEQNGIYF
jgi:hypothetical protein